jgi:2-polyprenyl-3-methyl-5-hydroxy-6-metoxy-1,4-benzoquinol methylase
MKVFGDAYEKSLSDVCAANQPSIPFFSSVTGQVIKSANTLTPSYWRSNLENPVLFNTAVRNIVESDLNNPVFLEIGPHSALAGPLRQIFSAENATLTYVSSLVRGQDDTESVYNAVGNLWRNNIHIDLSALYPTGSVLTDLPTYSWDHSVKFWDESRMCKEWKSREFLPHETLGVRLPGSSHLMPTWRKVLRLSDVPWIRDHVIGSDTVFPAVGYLSMAGEAIRQLTGRSDYSIRDFSIRSAMIVNDTRPVDVVTTFKRTKVTTTIETDWYDFRVTSFNGSTWSEHCSGQVRSGPARPNMLPDPQPDYLRNVSAEGWYRILERIGFSYGPTFRNMRDISANPIGHEAVCTVENIVDETSSFYEVHPRILDNLLQPMTVSMYQGNPTQFNQLSMPTYISEVYISGGMKEIKVTTKAWQDLMGAWCGGSFGTADGKLVCEMRGLKFSPLGESAEQQEELKHTVQAVWKPDIDLSNLDDLVRAPIDMADYTPALEKYFFLRALDTVKIMATVEEVKLPHGKKFRTWLNSYVDKVSRGDHVILPEGPQLASLSEDKRNSLIHELQDQLTSSRWTRTMETAIRRVHENSKGLLEGTAENIDYLMEDNVLMQIYAFFNVCWDYSPLLQVLGHCKPTMKILEIGAGTGGTTMNLLQGLISEFGERLYSRYSYTDISSGFFVAAKERFKDYQGIEYSVLDISKDPLKQGFEEGSYDLIVAANVLHATPSIYDTLSRVKKLLHPKGRLMLQEMDMPAKWVNFIMAGFSGWWLGEEDGRADEPYMAPDRWDIELKAAGFTGVDAKWYDSTPPFQVSATIISSPLQVKPAKKSVSFLYRGTFDARLESYRTTFEASGHSVQPVPFGSRLPINQDVVSFLELESPFFHDIERSDFEHWVEIVGKIGTEKWLWITRTSSMGAKEPGYSMSLGFVRTLRSEKKTSITTLELDDVDAPDISQKVVILYEKINSGPPDDDMEPDFEYAIKNGVIHLPRYHWISVKDELEKATEDVENKYLCIGQKGSLNGLRWENNEAVSRPCRGDEIAIRPHTVGVNFRVSPRH